VKLFGQVDNVLSINKIEAIQRFYTKAIGNLRSFKYSTLEIVQLTTTSSSQSGFRSISHLQYRKPALKKKQVLWACQNTIMPALLPGTGCQSILSLSQTLNIVMRRRSICRRRTKSIVVFVFVFKHLKKLIKTYFSYHDMSAGLFCRWTISL